LRKTAHNLGIVPGDLLAYLFEGCAHQDSIVAAKRPFRQAFIV
jgi:hypothetical protein